MLALTTALLAGLAHPPGAAANEMTVFSCHTPAGEAVGHDGWQNVRTADLDMVAEDSCAGDGAGSMSLELQANDSGYQNGAQSEWVFQAPAWASVASYTVSLGGSYAIPSTGGGSGQAFVNASDENDPNYDYRNLGAGSQGPWVISRTPPTAVSTVTLNASCDGQDGPCPANARIAVLDLSEARMVLRDPTSPTVSSLSGSLLPGSTVQGTGEADFTASDAGPGIYSAQLTVDGASQAPVLLDQNGGWCQNLGQTSDGTRSFAHPDPCMASVSGAVALDTTSLADGQHSLRLTVDDASGNATTAFNGTITTRNAPTSSSAPAITPAAADTVGSELTASSGGWSAPDGAGAITYGYEWQDCDTRGQECEAIPVANSSGYAASAADVGHTLRVTVTASDRDGASTATSAATAPVAPGNAMVSIPPAVGPNGTAASRTASLRLAGRSTLTRGYTDSAVTVSGTLTGSGLQPIAAAQLDILESSGNRTRLIAHAKTSPDGTFTAHVPAGPSRSLTVAYRAYADDPGYAATAGIRESVAAGVRLSVTPRHTSPTGTIVLSGAVLGQVPRAGVIAELLVRYRGQWEPFRTPRTDSHGRFRVRYQFQGATGRFPFRAQVPAGQAAFGYSGGHSPTVVVTSS